MAEKKSKGGYQVFLNYCKTDHDLRLRFVDYLHHVMVKKGLRVFVEDDHKEEKTRRRAIDDCRVYIPIFSKGYASNKSFLQELEAVIVQSNKSAVDKMIMPIFFDVAADNVLQDFPVLKREGQPWELKDTGYVKFCEKVAMEVPIKCNAETLNRIRRLSAASRNTTAEEEKLSIPAKLQDYSYDVFLSFRRLDTRQEFVNVIRESMKKADISFFEDDPVLIAEDDLERLSRAIDNSELCAPILSKTYASSLWCLLELEKMVQFGKKIIPIFYGVEQNRVVEMYLADLKVHEKNISSEIAEQWKRAIERVSAMKGWEVKDEGAFKFSRYFSEHIFAQLPGTQQDQAKEAALETKEEKYGYEVFLSFRGVDANAQLVADHLYKHLVEAGTRVFKNVQKLSIGDKIETIPRVIKTSKICILIFSRMYTSSKWCLRELARMVEYEKEIVPIFYGVKPDDIGLNIGHQEVFPIEETQRWKEAVHKVSKIKGWELKYRGYEEAAVSYADHVRTEKRDKLKDISEEAADIRSLQIIDGRGSFNVTGLENFINGTELAQCHFSYAVVSVMGHQSSGKSTLLNRLFHTNFVEMGGYRREQTTVGAWLAKDDGVSPPILVMDLEGCDGRGRGENDTTFFKQIALFALAVSDIVIINIWLHDIGRESAGRKPLMRTIFQVYYKTQFISNRQTTLMFVIRDYDHVTSREKLQNLLRKDIEEIWNCIPQRIEHNGSSRFSDIFNIGFHFLSHPVYEEAHFLEDMNRLRWSILSITEHLDARDIPAGEIPTSFHHLWELIKNDKDLNLHEHRGKEAKEKSFPVQLERVSALTSAGAPDLSPAGPTPTRNLKDLPLIAKEVLLSLKAEQRLAANHLVGIDGDEGCLSDLLRLIDVNVPDVRHIVICGQDGVGKTTLAKAVFNQLSHYFDCCSFIENVSASYEDYGGSWWKKLRAQILLDLLGDRVAVGPQITEGIPLASSKLLRDKRVLIVLDDVNEDNIKEVLLRLPELVTNQLAIGSRDLIRAAIVGKSEVYEMRVISPYRALELFKLYAFGSTPPGTANNHLNDLANKIVAHNLGYLPLAVEIAGSFVSRQPLSTWKRMLEKLSESHAGGLEGILKICYEELEDSAKQIFLDVACFFADQEKTNAFYMWGACGLSPDKGIKALLSMSLIKVTANNRLWMHDLVRQFGREIVTRENSKNPELRSRVWRSSDARKLLRGENLQQGSKVEAIRLTGGEVEGDIFKGLQNLRFLALNAVRCKGEPRMFDSNLKWLSWHTSEFEDFEAGSLDVKYLVVLDLSRSYDYNASPTGSERESHRLPYLKEPDSLKVLDLSGWRELTHIPDLYRFKSLERLVLEGCESLVGIEDSLGSLRSLKYLNIKRCYSLKGLPEDLSSLTCLAEIVMEGNGKSFTVPEEIGMVKSLAILEISIVRIRKLPESIGKLQKLKKLSLFGCKGVRVLPESHGHLKSLVELDISYSDVTELPGSIGDLRELKQIKMEYCSMTYLPVTLGSMEKLEEFYAKGCTQLTGELPESIGKLSNLRVLDLSHTAIWGIPETNQLSSPGTLSLGMCNDLRELPDLPVSLTRLKFTSNRMRRIPDISKLNKLVDLVLSDFTDMKSRDSTEYAEQSKLQSPSGNWLGPLPLLQILNLNIRHISRLPFEVVALSHLKTLILSCPDLNLCPQFPPCLSKLVLRFLKESTELFPLSNLKRLLHLQFDDCLITDDMIGILKIGEIASLEHLYISRCSFRSLCGLNLPENLIRLEMNHNNHLEELPQLGGLQKLRHLVLLDCPSLSEIEFSLGNLESLKNLRIEGCEKHMNVRGLINLGGLQELSIQHCNSSRELEKLGRLRHLRVLKIDSCLDLVKFDGLEELKHLQELFISGCHSLERLEFKNWNMELRVIKLESCMKLVIDYLGGLNLLQELSISGCDSVQRLLFGQFEKMKVVRIDSCKGLKTLNVSGRSDSFLEELSISGCDSLEILALPMSLKLLRVDKVESRKDLKITNLGRFHSLQEMSISGCVSLETSSFKQLKQLRVLNIDSYKGLANGNDLGELDSLEELSISGCHSLERLQISNLLQWLRIVKVERCKELVVIELGELHSLQELSISGCDSLTGLALQHLKSFKVLHIGDCKELNGIAGLTELKSLQELSIIGCATLQDLGDLSKLRDLNVVHIRGCSNLKSVEGLHTLPFLKNLQISDCKSFESNLDGLKPAKRSLPQNKRGIDFARKQKKATRKSILDM